MNARASASTLFYRAGVWQSYHRFANQHNLTVVAFHSVVPAGSPEWTSASRTWTVSMEIFEQCLRFFTAHYQVVNLAQVLDAAGGNTKLPDRPLLITFDDGWDDNERYALGMLRKHKVPAVVFAVAGWVGGNAPWNEVLMRAWQDGGLGPEIYSQWWLRAGGDPHSMPENWKEPAAILGLIVKLAALNNTEKMELVRLVHDRDRYAGRRLATLDQLKNLQAGGVSIGSHGLTHLPIALAEDPRRELGESRKELAALFGEDPPVSISFPHGSYDSSVVRVAFEEGYKLLFTSDACVNHCENGRPSRVLGRIAILEHEITDENGQFRPSRMAQWLFRRPALSLN